jgi:AcrR family transcriptional regulator
MDDTRQRIVEAAYACVARRGLAKTTVEDAAREAAVSRATVYRTFPGGREELISAVVSWAMLDFFGRLYEHVQRGVAPGADVDEAADFLARMILSHISAPGRWDLDDPDQVARLVESELLAGVVAGPPRA